MSFNSSVWDITKSVFLLSIIALVCLFYFDFRANFHKNDATVRKGNTEIIGDNVVARNAVEDSKKDVLIKKLKKEKSVALTTIKKKNEEIEELGQINAKLKQTRRLSIASDKIYNKEAQDKKNWYFFKKITIRNKDNKDIPVAWAMFYPYQTPNKQWKIGTYDMNVDLKIIESESRDGNFNRYAEVNLLDKDYNKLPVKVTDIKWERVRLKSNHFLLWNPRFGLGGAVAPGAAATILNFSVASYGKTDNDMNWRFLTFGLGNMSDDGKNRAVETFEPFSYNVGKLIPPLRNLFIGPVFIRNSSETYNGFSVSVPF